MPRYRIAGPRMEAAEALPLLLSLAEAARRLGVSRQLMRRLIDTGEIATVRVGSRRKVVTESLIQFTKKPAASDRRDG